MVAILSGAALEGAKDLLRGGVRFFAGALGGREVQLGGGRRIALRPGTSDLEVVRQVWRDTQYAIVHPELAARLTAFEADIRARGQVPVIVDAGANIGASALWLAREWPNARVLAIEPDPGNAGQARGNCAATGNVTVIEAPIGSEPGFVTLSADAEAYAITTARAATGCPVVTVAQCLEQVEHGELFAAKIDIEGFEADLFAAETEWLDTVKLVYIEPHDHLFPGRATSRTFQAEMGKRDFDVVIRGENLVYIRR